MIVLVVWRITQILNKKDLSFWAGATKTGSALVGLAYSMPAKSIFYTQKNKKEWEAVHKIST